MDLAGGEEEGWDGEDAVGEGVDAVGEGDGAEVEGVDLVSDLARELEEAGEGLEKLWSVHLLKLLTMCWGEGCGGRKGICDTMVRSFEVQRW